MIRESCKMVVVLALLSGSVAWGQAAQQGGALGTTVPRVIQFSGIAQDSGQPLSGSLALTFSLYRFPEGGTPLWSETQNVAVDSQGRYTAYLGAASPNGLPLILFTTGAARWLAVQPEGHDPGPRVLLVGVPYALKAADADTLGGKPASAFAKAAQPSGNGIHTVNPGSNIGPTVTITTDANGNDFGVTGGANSVTLSLPTASSTNRGALGPADFSRFDQKAGTGKCPTNQFEVSDATPGPNCVQPAFSNLIGSATFAQLPFPSWSATSQDTVTAQPASGQDVTAVKIRPNVTSPTADVFQVFDDQAQADKAFVVAASGSITFKGNNIKMGTGTQYGSVAVDDGTGAYPVWSSGHGAPSGPCQSGSFFSRTDGAVGSTWYVCEGGVWTAK